MLKSKVKLAQPKKIKKESAIHYREIIFPAILTILITFCLMFLIVLMTVSHSLGPMDRQYIAQFSGMFGVAFTSCCVFWFKDKRNKRGDD